MKSRFLTLAAAAIMFAIPSLAAAQNAVATGNVNVRIGPGTQHPVIGSLPAGAPVMVRGCVRGYAWCDTQFGGLRGWVSGSYLAGYEGYRGRSFVDIAPALGIGIIAGTIFSNTYDRGYYYDRHGYNDSRRWSGHSSRESRRYSHSSRESRGPSHSSRNSRGSSHSSRESRGYSHSSRESRGSLRAVAAAAHGHSRGQPAQPLIRPSCRFTARRCPASAPVRRLPA